MADTPIRRTWEQREYILLEFIARAEEEQDEPLVSWLLAASTGLDDRDVQLGLRALYEAGYIAGNDAGINQRTFDLIDIRLLERGRRAVGQWPSEDTYNAFFDILNERIVAAESDEERTQLEQVRDTALAVGRDVVTSVLSALARQMAGLP
jgi:hypothetical protein